MKALQLTLLSLFMLFFSTCSNDKNVPKSAPNIPKKVDNMKANNANINHRKTEMVTLPPSHEKTSTLERIICCNGIPAYLKPSMTSGKKGGILKRGKKIQLTKIIPINDNRSFDFGETIINKKKYYVPMQYLTEVPQEQEWDKDSNGKIIGIKIGLEKVDRWHPLPIWYAPKDLVVIPKQYRAPGYQWRKMKLRHEAWIAFRKMIDAANKAGIEIKLISCYRSFAIQEGPYKSTIAQVGPKQLSSAKPGYSEHQLGTTADVSSKEVGYGLTQNFAKTSSYRWIKENSPRFGIYHSYTKENYKNKGYIWEPWHLRYWGNYKPN